MTNQDVTHETVDLIDAFPEIPAGLVELLASVFPRQEILPGTAMEQIQYDAGIQRMVAYLRQVEEHQHENR